MEQRLGWCTPRKFWHKQKLEETRKDSLLEHPGRVRLWWHLDFRFLVTPSALGNSYSIMPLIKKKKIYIYISIYVYIYPYPFPYPYPYIYPYTYPPKTNTCRGNQKLCGSLWLGVQDYVTKWLLTKLWDVRSHRR